MIRSSGAHSRWYTLCAFVLNMISHACVNDLLIAAYSNITSLDLHAHTDTPIVYDCRCLILDVPPRPRAGRWRSAVRLLMAPMLVLKPRNRPLPLLLLQLSLPLWTARPHLLLA